MDEKDTSFITNTNDNTLFERFKEILSEMEYFDCLVGYFYVSGFYKLQEKLKDVDKIRILVGMGIDSQTFQLIEDSKTELISAAEFKEKFSKDIIKEMNNSENSSKVEKGAKQFIEWLKEGKIEIKGYKKRKTHSKLYIMTLRNRNVIKGTVITGSSNFTHPGLEKNLEFNVELNQRENYIFACEQFEKLWAESEELTEEFVNNLTKNTWLRDDITLYEMYYKFLYEYLSEKIDNDLKDLKDIIKPPKFKYLKYQRDAVFYAKQIINEHGGVFLSDVVGLGKTYMGALLAQQLQGRTLVIAPPALVDKYNPGGWYRVLKEFEVNCEVESKGKLDKILENIPSDSYMNVIIDEAHDYRNEDTQLYDKLSRICKNKKVILISATPFNNSPSDLLSLIKLFQPAHNSTIPNCRDIEDWFKKLINKQNNIDRVNDYEKYVEVNKEISKSIRENVLKYLMIRRTRNGISQNYAEDLEENNMKFPDVEKPQPIFYEFNEDINNIFEKILISLNEDLTYAKYRPLAEEYQINPDSTYFNSQKMMENLIKILLMKRLESSSYSFKKSIRNSIEIHEKAIKTFEERNKFYTSRDYNWVYNILEDEDIDHVEELIEELIEKGKIKEYSSSDFKPQFILDLKSDLEVLKGIKDMWDSIEDYPKNIELKNLLNNELKDKKVIIFTEYIDTAEDITDFIRENCTDKVIMFSGKSTETNRQTVLNNFDDNVDKENQKNDFNILVTTDSLSHGVNLHRSNIIINFDIPWNPTKMMQRVGRVQRLDTQFDKIFTYNFFPAEAIEDEINLQKSAENKISMFIDLLGNDSQLLTDEPIKSHDLFTVLNSEFDDGDEFFDQELFYLKQMRDLRDNNEEFYNHIVNLPKKAKVTRKSQETSLITLMKVNKSKKIFKSTSDQTYEVDFFDAVKELYAEKDEEPIIHDEEYYEYLHKNLKAIEELGNNSSFEPNLNNNEKRIIDYIDFCLENIGQTQEYNRRVLIKFRELVEEGHIWKNRDKNLIKELECKYDLGIIVDVFGRNINDEDWKTNTGRYNKEEETTEIILSEYFLNEGG